MYINIYIYIYIYIISSHESDMSMELGSHIQINKQTGIPRVQLFKRTASSDWVKSIPVSATTVVHQLYLP